MKKTALIFLLISSLTGYAQEEIPDVYSVASQFERIEIVRMRSGTDILEGLKTCIAEKHIKNAVILSGIGSVTDYYYNVVNSRNLPPTNEYREVSEAMDLIALQGYIFNGRIHAHITLSDINSVVGGHLEPETRALTFFIVTLGILPDDLEIENFDNYTW